MKNYIFASKEIENLATELKELLNDGGSYSGATIVAQTSVTLQPKKNGCPYGKKDNITKLCLYGCSVNGIYKNAVNNNCNNEEKKMGIRKSIQLGHLLNNHFQVWFCLCTVLKKKHVLQLQTFQRKNLQTLSSLFFLKDAKAVCLHLFL